MRDRLAANSAGFRDVTRRCLCNRRLFDAGIIDLAEFARRTSVLAERTAELQAEQAELEATIDAALVLSEAGERWATECAARHDEGESWKQGNISDD